MQDSAKDFGTLYDPEMAINKRSQIRTLIHRLVDQSASGTPVDTGDPVSPEADGLQSVLPERESSKCLPADKHRSKDSGPPTSHWPELI